MEGAGEEEGTPLALLAAVEVKPFKINSTLHQGEPYRQMKMCLYGSPYMMEPCCHGNYRRSLADVLACGVFVALTVCSWQVSAGS